MDGTKKSSQASMLLLAFRAKSPVFMQKLFNQNNDEKGTAMYNGMQSPKFQHLIGWLQGDDNERNNAILAKDVWNYFVELNRPGVFFQQSSCK